MRFYGLIGYPLSHSFSPEYFQNKFQREEISDAEYHLFPLDNIREFPGLIKRLPFQGLNVTTPYKETVIPFLDEVDSVAHEINAVNTIQFIRDHGGLVLKGYNTDVIGFRKSLEPLLQPHHKKALILGNGGASNAVAYVLRDLGISFQKVGRIATRSDVLSYSELIPEDFLESSLIINATPAGTQGCKFSFPCITLVPQLRATLGPQHLLYDLVYNPGTTPLLQLGKECGTMIKNGTEMLYKQAEAAWEIWNL
ncbi:MAG: shikimate dehydrogenase [Bacteroidota bacterium]